MKRDAGSRINPEGLALRVNLKRRPIPWGGGPACTRPETSKEIFQTMKTDAGARVNPEGLTLRVNPEEKAHSVEGRSKLYQT